jgi:hypothetical protein
MSKIVCIPVGSYFAKQAREEVIKQNGCLVFPISKKDIEEDFKIIQEYKKMLDDWEHESSKINRIVCNCGKCCRNEEGKL